MSLIITETTRDRFARFYYRARRRSAQILNNTEPKLATSTTFYLCATGRAGFGVTSTGELVHLFSLDRGNGDILVRHAVATAGASHLNAFDGYLTELYARHGFLEDRREPNWTPGGPDVVFMSLSPFTALQLTPREVDQLERALGD